MHNEVASLITMEIFQYIKDLLYQDDCVIVPNLGAFVGRRIPASFDAKRGLFLPERKEILFNGNIHHNDGVLANYLAQKENISFSESLKRIDDFSVNISNKIDAGDVVIFPNFGEMRRVEGRVIFVADSSSTFLPDTYGFTAISATPHAVYTRRSRLPYIAASAVFLAGLLLISPEIKDVDSQSVVTASFASEVSVLDPSEMLATPAVETVAETVEVEEVTEVTEEVEKAVERKNFHIIVASFTNRRDAQGYVNRHQKNHKINRSSYEILGEGKRFRVSAGSFATREEAQANRKYYGKSWILEGE